MLSSTFAFIVQCFNFDDVLLCVKICRIVSISIDINCT